MIQNGAGWLSGPTVFQRQPVPGVNSGAAGFRNGLNNSFNNGLGKDNGVRNGKGNHGRNNRNNHNLNNGNTVFYPIFWGGGFSGYPTGSGFGDSDAVPFPPDSMSMQPQAPMQEPMAYPQMAYPPQPMMYPQQQMPPQSAIIELRPDGTYVRRPAAGPSPYQMPQGYGMPQQGYSMPPQQGNGMPQQGYSMPPQQGNGVPPQPYGMPQAYNPADADAPARPQEPDPPHFLIAFKDHTVYSAVAYWFEGDTLHYFTNGSTHNQASISLIDRQLTERLNREMGIDFRLPR